MKITDMQRTLLFVALLLSAWLIYRLGPILTPFLLGALLAYLGRPAVDKLMRITASRSLAVLLVFFVIAVAAAAVLIVILPLLQEQITRLLLRVPGILDYLREHIASVAASLGAGNTDTVLIKQVLAGHWQELAQFTVQLSNKLYGSWQILAMWLGYLFIIPVVTFYLLRDFDRLTAQAVQLIPQQQQSAIIKLAAECDVLLSAFFRGQLLVMLSQAVIYSVALALIGLEFALLVGMLTGFVSFIPYLGFIIGFSVAALIALAQFQEWIYLFYLLGVFSLGQMIESMLLSPLLIGDKIGLHPVTVLFSVLAGGQLFGFFGLLLALPAAAVLTVLLRHIHRYYSDAPIETG